MFMIISIILGAIVGILLCRLYQANTYIERQREIIEDRDEEIEELQETILDLKLELGR